jgi:hypothetical protein
MAITRIVGDRIKLIKEKQDEAENDKNVNVIGSLGPQKLENWFKDHFSNLDPKAQEGIKLIVLHLKSQREKEMAKKNRVEK